MRTPVTALLLLCGFAFADTQSAVAIRNAKIVTVSGPAIAKGTVILRKGLIEAVGENVAIPADAWVVEGEGLRGASLEFFADGSMVGIVQAEGKEVTLKGRVQLEGDRFRVTTVGPAGGEEVSEPQVILELNDRRFVVQDSRGELLILERPQATGARAVGGAR